MSKREGKGKFCDQKPKGCIYESPFLIVCTGTGVQREGDDSCREAIREGQWVGRQQHRHHLE